jgi:hypothetical protein
MEISELLTYLKSQLEKVDNAGTIYASPVTDLPNDCAKFRGENDMRGAEISVGAVEYFYSGGSAVYQRVPIHISAYMSEKCGAKYPEFADYCADFCRQIMLSFPPAKGKSMANGGFRLAGRDAQTTHPVSFYIKERGKMDNVTFSAAQINFVLEKIIDKNIF